MPGQRQRDMCCDCLRSPLFLVVAADGLAAWALLRALGLAVQAATLGGLLVTGLPSGATAGAGSADLT
jgi:hypothetical protein